MSGWWSRPPTPCAHIDEVLERLGGACPVTGPFHLAGARPGGVVEVELHRVDPAPPAGEAWTGVFGGFGALQHEGATLQPPLEPELRRVPYRDGVAAFPVGGGRSVPSGPCSPSALRRKPLATAWAWSAANCAAGPVR